MKKRNLAAIIIVVAGLGSSMCAYAAPKDMGNGTVFDAEYYAATYPDVKAVFGTDETALYNHYIQYGKAEGRQACASAGEVSSTTNTSNVKLDAGDVKYLNDAYLAHGFPINEGSSLCPTYGFVRKDYSSDSYYQQLKAWIIDTINQNGGSKKINRLDVKAPFTKYYSSVEEATDASNMMANLCVDLMKAGYCKNIIIYDLPTDDLVHVNVLSIDWYPLCEINYD